MIFLELQALRSYNGFPTCPTLQLAPISPSNNQIRKKIHLEHRSNKILWLALLNYFRMREARSQPAAKLRITFQVQLLQNSAFFPVFWKSQFSVAATIYYIRGYLYFLFTILPEAGIIASHFTHDTELRGPHYPTTVTISMSQPGMKPRLSRVYDECPDHCAMGAGKLKFKGLI